MVFCDSNADSSAKQDVVTTIPSLLPLLPPSPPPHTHTHWRGGRGGNIKCGWKWSRESLGYIICQSTGSRSLTAYYDATFTDVWRYFLFCTLKTTGNGKKSCRSGENVLFQEIVVFMIITLEATKIEQIFPLWKQAFHVTLSDPQKIQESEPSQSPQISTIGGNLCRATLGDIGRIVTTASRRLHHLLQSTGASK